MAGRPNVGKSTLVNRITGARRSIVAPIAGTTRDVLAAPASWANRGFTLVDTGGLFGATTDPLHALVVDHGLRALQSADLVIFLVDGREGLVPGDEEIAHRLRALNKPIILVINKTDDKRSRPRVNEFHALGFEPMFEIAAEHGDGVYELLDQIIALLGDRATKDTLKDGDHGERTAESAGAMTSGAATTSAAMTTSLKRTAKPRWRSSAGPTSANPRSSIAWCAKSG